MVDARLWALLGCAVALNGVGCAGHAKGRPNDDSGRGGSGASGGQSEGVAGGGDAAGGDASAGAAGSNDEPVGAVDSCGAFDVKLTQGCGGCSDEPISCDCGEGNLWITLPCLAWNRCLQSLDCSALCEPKSRDGEGVPDFYTSQNQLQRCVSEKICEADGECPSGKCVHSKADGSGRCSWGKTGDVCFSEHDCFSGICAPGYGGERICQDGMPDQLCSVDQDCQSGICAPRGECKPQIETNAPLPPPGSGECAVPLRICQTGVVGQFCESGDQCTSGICPTLPGDWGTCSDGVIGRLCNQNQDCLEGSCLRQAEARVGYCSRGILGDPCTGGDCAEGSCQAKPLEGHFCYAGLPDDPCTQGADCESGLCVQPNPLLIGATCQLGDENSFCSSDDDCLSEMCVIPPDPGQPVRAYRCTPGAAGSWCWDSDDCLSGSCTPDDPPHEAARHCAP